MKHVEQKIFFLRIIIIVSMLVLRGYFLHVLTKSIQLLPGYVNSVVPRKLRSGCLG